MSAIVRKTVKHVTLTGLTPILFDRYPGDNKTVLTDPTQKLYLNKDRQVCLPVLNILSFLTAQNTDSAPKMCLDKRIYKSICSALLSSVSLAPSPLIPFLRNGKPLVFGAFEETTTDPPTGATDSKTGIEVVRHVARLDKGIPNPKERPMLSTPWTLKFTMTILPHPDLNDTLIENVFTDGGMRLGLGTYRRAFGKFEFAWT